MSAVLVVSHEPLEERMTGPSIRNWELSRVLARSHRVTLAVPGEPRRGSDAFEVVSYDTTELAELVASHDVVQASGYLLEHHPSLGEARHLVVDLYDPFPLETLHLYEMVEPESGHAMAARDREVLTRLIQAGDLFLCASERQRDFWCGWLVAAGRLNPFTHREDPALNHMVQLVPFGIPEQPPVSGAQLLRGIVPGIGEDDCVVLWGGGIWNWFDPLTLIRATASLRSRLPNLRVVFPAVRSPSPAVPQMVMAAEAVRLADELCLTGSHVFFQSGWVPYERRAAMLLEADIGVSLHLEGAETRYSFRTRVLDYLWAGLPVLTTEGDLLADMVDARDLGAVVPYQDAEAVAAAILQLAGDRDRRRACGERARAAGADYLWPVVARALVDYCDAPRRAPDHGRPMPLLSWPQAEPDPPPEPAGCLGEPVARPRGVLRRLALAYAEGGMRRVAEKGAARLWRNSLS